jgi:prepilin-type N-terminal cleavage/methylation domain-containing protein
MPGSRVNRCRRYHGKNRGFTLIEMMIVVSMILILLAVAIPAYNQSILRARESVLRQDLFTLRSVISQFTLDKQRAPQSLDDIVQAGYIKQVPNDPFTIGTTPGSSNRKTCCSRWTSNSLASRMCIAARI